MASLSYELMTTFGDKAKVALRAGDYEVGFAWEHCVNAVNNVHHGKYVVEWLPQVAGIIGRLKELEPELAHVYDEALEFVEIVTPE
jgi:hypothetical protein